MLGFLSSRDKWPELASMIVSAIWLAICVIYIDCQVGWSSITAFLPHEIGAAFTGVICAARFPVARGRTYAPQF